MQLSARKSTATAGRSGARVRCRTARVRSCAAPDAQKQAVDSSSSSKEAFCGGASCSGAHSHAPVARRAVLSGAAMGAAALAGGAANAAAALDERRGEILHTDEEWQQILKPGPYQVLRKAATEPPFSSPLYYEKRKGMFVCAGCRSPLFPSATKYESGTGWPSFYKPVDGALEETLDTSIWFMPRTEYRCSKCKGHIGHVFNDGPAPTGLRYCCNGLAMEFVPEEQA